MQDFQLRQKYRDKIYNYRPYWILRWGISFFFLFLLLIIIASSFIRFPDVVPATAEITAINPPAHRIANVTGKIEKVMVNEGQKVSKDEILLLLESSAKLEDVKTVENYLPVMDSLLSINNINDIPSPSCFNENLELGEIQTNYSDVLMSYLNLHRFLNSGLFMEKFLAFKEKLQTQKRYLVELKNKNQLLNEQFEIGKNKYIRDSLMYLKGGISQSELEASFQKILQFKSSMTDLNMNLLNGKSTCIQTGHELCQLTMQNKFERQQLTANLLKSIQLLRAQIDLWKKLYVVDAPVDGTVSFTSYWTENQNVKSGEVVVSVVPEDSMKIKVRIRFPIQNSGKVKTGQRVNIKLQNFPYQEYGMLVGKMATISKVPNDLHFSADVVLDNGLITSYGEKLPKANQLIGEAEILTDEYSLLLRFFNPLKAIFDESIKK